VEEYREPESITRIIESKHVDIGGSSSLAIGTRQPAFLREVYYFLCGVVHRAATSSEDILSIVEGEISAWASILKAPQVLDVDSQTGLLGELWVLWRSICIRGPRALEAWTGPSRELHDFQTSTEDLEIKTTLAHQRNHVITSLSQLTVKPERRLFVVSIQLRPAGAGPGISLAEAYDRIVELLVADRLAAETFKRVMRDCGYLHENSHLYTPRFGLRSHPTVVKVDDSFPRLTPELIAKAMHAIAAARLRAVTYTVNLDGLGHDIDACQIPDLVPPAAGDLYE
jgi:hypothetical protein